ncbi:CPBP family intramembrane glutamic endopeptidase [Anaerocolumna sp. AGMB13020]|uniref:CPBP family intramembrane glutamic endopeptidase n=1 Tax=Anaerocolumna sp. AGMB13020 TaxID=3081750 RepID=UPI002955A4E0|nr:CPBP family intramembrane glutamic endopeptidase [Anaerocolumna sp. AGMB13020]WOO35303.1 CPBP family intramembrane glutamic endopeptidase [Anaerocolumna sp. AGMB13020]
MKQKFSQKHPYFTVVLAGLLCTFMTALGVAFSQIRELDTLDTYLAITGFLAASVIIGLIIMKKSGSGLDAYGVCRGKAGTGKKVVWYLPIFLIEILPVAVYGFQELDSVVTTAILLLYTLAVGINEEIYFRGIALKVLKIKGKKKAVIGASVIFGVFHVVNLLNGKNILYIILQVAFAFLVGLVLAEIVCITGSLIGVIAWHTTHDFIAYSTGDVLDTKGLIILTVQVAVLLGFSVYLWKSAVKDE